MELLKLFHEILEHCGWEVLQPVAVKKDDLKILWITGYTVPVQLKIEVNSFEYD